MPKVFISYSHDSIEHENQVLALSDRLRRDGIDAQIDQYEIGPPEGWIRWMRNSIRSADFVLVICTEAYQRRAEGREEAGKGWGGNREGHIVDQELYESDGKNVRFIAVIFRNDDRLYIPDFLRPYQNESVATEEGYLKLYRRLTRQPEVLKPEIGRMLSLPQRERTSSLSQADQSTRHNPSRPRLGLHGVPAPPLKFVGRSEDQADLLQSIREKHVEVLALKGMPGIGKTALALKLAHELKVDYPHAQFYFDLKGESPLPLEPKQIMEMVVRAFDDSHEAFNSQEYEQSVYLNVLHDKRVLLIMDNARDTQQVLPLRPQSTCLMLVTSRWALDVPDQRDLTVLSEDESFRLLTSIAPRLNQEMKVMEIAQMCGYLPIALNAVGRALEKNRNLSVSEYLVRLHQAEERILQEIDPGLQRNTAAVLQSSYDLLDAELQAHFRTLSIFPATFDQPAAEAVWAVEPERARLSLNELDTYSLVGFDLETQRYRLHDLVRVFARTLMSFSERGLTGQRHSEHYLLKLQYAESQYVGGEKSRVKGIEVLNSEWSNIQAGQLWAQENAIDSRVAAELCWRYPHDAQNCLRTRLHGQDRIHWLQAAYDAAKRLGNLEWEAMALSNLGGAFKNSGDYCKAVECHEQHLKLAREQKERRWENEALFGLGLAYASFGQFDRAIDLFKERLQLSKELGDLADEAAGFGGLGDVYYQLEKYDLARDCHMERLRIERGLHGANRVGEGHALHGLGRAYHKLNNFNAALSCHREHLSLSLELNDPLGEHTALGGMGEVLYSLGDYNHALDNQMRRIDIAKRIGDQLGLGRGYLGSALALYGLGNYEEAIRRAEDALRIFEMIKAPEATKVIDQLSVWRNIASKGAAT